MPRFHLVTLFPEFFDSPLSTALMGKAGETGLLTCSFFNPRDFSLDKHRHVDDRPYGGGPGMVMRAEPVAAALRAIAQPGRILLMAPGGRPLTQALARELAAEDNITIVCGRYEGLDARLLELFAIEPVSVGEAVLNGGETAALAVLESVARLIPGFMGKEESGDDESFSNGLLEYPHYTRPEELEGLAVPEILRSGDHARIAAYRREASLAATLAARPDLLDTAPLSGSDASYLAGLPRERPGRNLSFCLMHYPVLLGEKNSGASSLTNLDVHDIGRVSRSYGMGPFYVTSPLEDQLRVLDDILRHWTRGPGGLGNPDRARALEIVRPARSLEEAVADLTARTGARPLVLASSAVWPGSKKKSGPPLLTPRDVLNLCRQGPVLLCLGTGHGLAPEVTKQCDGLLRPLRFLGYNHLSVRAAAAVMADRILGDYC